MDLIAFGPDDAAAISRAVAIGNAVNRSDSPWQPPMTEYRFAMEMRHGWDGEVARHYLATAEDGTVVGHASLATSEWDNRELAWFGADVHPDHRRRGHGTTMLAELEGLAVAAGRPLVGIDGWDSPGVIAFAARVGLERKSQSIQRRMMLREVGPARIHELREGALGRGSAYDLIRIAGRVPEDLVEAVAEVTAAINDAPTDELEYEDEVFPIARIRSYETAQIDGGHRLYRLLARHRDSGELAGQSVVSVDAELPELGDQHDTSVVRAHRGHRLGLLLKTEMALWLLEAEPELTQLDTWNAESNQHMVAVNEQLGYQVMGRELMFQRRLG